MKNHRLALSFATLAAFASCRNDDADRQLAWSCANTKVSPPQATSECMKQIEAQPGDILKYYRAVPRIENGKIASYAFYLQDDRRKAQK